jgi:hypothetical protein
MAGPRTARLDPSRQRRAGTWVYIPRRLRIPLEEMSLATRRKPMHLFVDGLDELLRKHGYLVPLREPEEFMEGEESFVFPWTEEHTGRFPATKMVWFSRDPDKKTWSTFLRSLEYETDRTQTSICKEYGVSLPYAHRIWSRFERWREGESTMPGFAVEDVLQKRGRGRPCKA